MEKIRELIVELKGKKYGLCTLDGENVVDHQYSHIIQFGNDTYALKRRHTYQLYDSHMKLLHPYKFFQISLITHNQYLVQYKNTFQRKVFGLISMEGHVIIKPKYHSLTIVPSSDPVWFLAEDRKGMRIAYDRQMNEIRKWPTTHYVEYLGEGYFLEQDTHWEKIPLDDPRNEKCGAVRGWNPSFSYTITDVHGIPIEIPVIDNHISEFRYGLTRVTTYDGFIFYNRNLESILPQPVYAGIFGSDGVLSIKIDEQSDWHYINEKGKRLFGRNFFKLSGFYRWVCMDRRARWLQRYYRYEWRTPYSM